MLASLRERRPTPLVEEMVGRWRSRGIHATVSDPDLLVTPLDGAGPRGDDLVVLKSGTEAALSAAGALAATGWRVVNPWPVAAACRDKIVQTAVLRHHGLPVPDSWLVSDPRRLAEHLRRGPLVVKDPRGSRGRDVHVVTDAGQLDLLAPGRPWLVMRYHRPEGPDLKLYRIGDDVVGVERVFPARTLAEKVGTPFTVDAALRAVVLRCGEAFGTDLYGVDVVRSRGRRWVVDMSAFPGFKGVPDAGARIADHLLSRAEVAA